SEIAYTAPPMPVREQAWSTDHNIWTVNLTSGERKQITTSPAADIFPRYSPDGKSIAYRAQARAGFEADRWKLMLYDRKAGSTKSLTPDFDYNVETIVWSHDGKGIYFDAEDKANKPIWEVSSSGGTPHKVIDGDVNGDFSFSGDGETICYAHQKFTRPVEVY